MLLRFDGPCASLRTGDSRFGLLIMGKYRVVVVNPSEKLGGGNVGVPDNSMKGLVGVLMLRPPHLEQRYLSTVVCWIDGLRGDDPVLQIRRGW